MKLTSVKIARKVPKFGFSTLLLLVLITTFQVDAQTPMPKRGYAIDWLVPRSNVAPKVPRFNRMEIGIAVPDSIEKQIQRFIESGTGLNPFDPAQLDFYVEFKPKALGDSAKRKINAFYFQDYERIATSPKLEQWYWKPKNTEDHLRVRFTPNLPGMWEFIVVTRINGKETSRMGPYTFTCVDSKNKGFVKVASNHQYLELGGENFMPVGQNLPKPSCYVQRDASGKVTRDLYGCATCPCAGTEEWCAHLRHLPMLPKPYLAYQQEMERLKLGGANYFRTLIFPNSYEIEFEQLGNYSKRMHCAWEMDEMIQHAADLGLYMQLNLFLPYALGNAPYGVRAWDWYKQPEENGDIAYCYASELGLKEPIEFLTNEKARSFFKQKLRYMVARWGYAPQIAVLELMSEINGVFPNNPKEIYAWQLEMARYIREELGHKDQLLTVSYNGARPDEAGGDLSFTIPYLDLITHNTHRLDIERVSLQKLFDASRKYNKPLIFSEVGTSDTEVERCDGDVEWLKDLWLTMFSGTASAGINWNNYHNIDLWKNLGIVNKFAQQINWNNYTQHQFQRDKKGKVGALALLDPAHQNVIGAVHNLTWNYYTNGQNCGTAYPPDEKFRTYADQAFAGRKGVFVLGLKKGKRYVIEWINPFTGEKLSESTVQAGRKGKLLLPHPPLTKQLGMLVFRIHPENEAFAVKPTIQVIRKNDGEPLPKE